MIVFSPAVSGETQQPVLQGDAQRVLERWFEVDSHDLVTVTRKELTSDDLGARYRLEFRSGDGQQVNGILAMPANGSKPARLALALHPMGSDSGIWWKQGKPLFGNELTARLRQLGYAVLALDARQHGERADEALGVREILTRAHSDNPAVYNDMIVGSVRDYRQVLIWASQQDDLDTQSVLAIGYSMGAQMSLLLSSYEPNISAVLAIVPPYVQQPYSPVAPRQHASRIKGSTVMLLAADQDPYSSKDQNEHLFEVISSTRKEILFFDSGHVLPEQYLEHALGFIEQNAARDES